MTTKAKTPAATKVKKEKGERRSWVSYAVDRTNISTIVSQEQKKNPVYSESDAIREALAEKATSYNA